VAKADEVEGHEFREGERYRQHVLVLIDYRPNALAVQALRIDWEARLLKGF
jgi:hypothetical protein